MQDNPSEPVSFTKTGKIIPPAELKSKEMAYAKAKQRYERLEERRKLRKTPVKLQGGGSQEQHRLRRQARLARTDEGLLACNSIDEIQKMLDDHNDRLPD